jgi:hypothetical protein
MFEAELCRHPDVAHVAYSRHTYAETQYWLQAACLLGAPGTEFLAGRPYYAPHVARAFLLDNVRGNVPGYVPPPDDEALVHDAWEAMGDSTGTPVFFEKSPHHLPNWAALDALLAWMARTEKAVRLVGLVRNPMPTQHSAYRLFGSLPAARQFAWAQTYRNLLALQALVPPEQLLVVRYEDLVAEPAAAFGAVCDFVGVERRPEVGEGVRPDDPAKWRGDAGFTLQLHPGVRRLAHHFGYTDAELYNPPKPEPGALARRREAAASWLRHRKARLMNRTVKPALARLRGA